MGLFTLAWNSILEIGKLVALPVAKARGSRRLGQVLRWTLHALALVVIFGCLAWLNYTLDLEQLLRTPWHAVGHIWLPLMFGLMYALAWLGWWLWRLAAAPSAGSPHPDIDDAWREAMTALDQAGIDLTSTPLFLVLGRPASNETGLFHAAGMQWTVPQAPRRRDAPLHVYANEEAVFLTCAGVSLLGEQAEMYARAASETPAKPGTLKASELAPLPREDDAPSWSNEPFAPPTEWSHESEQGLHQLEQGVALLVQEAPPVRSAPQESACETQPHASVLALGNEVERCTERMAHLCRLIADVRRPYCPINAAIVLTPLAATDSDADANNLAAVVARELDQVQTTLAVRCPLVALVCDLERADGCQEFIDRMPDEQRRRRLGVTFPHLGDCDVNQLSTLIADGLRWLCQDLAPSLVYRMIPPPRSRTEADERELTANLRRYQFLSQLRDRETRLARILTRSIHSGEPGWSLRGCYLAATGMNAEREQAFVAGIFPPLLQLQNSVAWTPAALREDRACRCATMAGYAILCLFSVVTAALLLW